MLGSSIGFEAYFAALTFGVETIGVELLCSLSRLSEEVRRAHDVPTSLTRFACADALTITLPPSTAMVYVDDTAWDEPTVRQLARKLARELPRGAIVVHNSVAGYEDEPASYRALEAYDVGTSWNAAQRVYAWEYNAPTQCGKTSPYACLNQIGCCDVLKEAVSLYASLMGLIALGSAACLLPGIPGPRYLRPRSSKS